MKLNLTEKDVEKLVESIEDPQPPNEELVTAARKYRLLEATRLAEESWEGCDGCDENDKHFFIQGYIAAYYAHAIVQMDHLVQNKETPQDKTFKKKSQWTKVNK